VIDVPALSRELLTHVPVGSALGQWIEEKSITALTPPLPAVTCTVQASLTTGTPPSRHGIIANGLPTFRSREDQALVDASNFASYRKEISFWEQSNQFLDQPRFWQDAGGKSAFKTALLFFQNSMPGFAGTPRPAADIVLTPKPDHGSDGKLVSLCWSEPRELVPQLFKELGPFPLMNYWGPMAGIASSQWIARAAAMVWEMHQPQLQWTYIPHLDYDLQRFGPRSPQAQQAVADLTGALEPLLGAVLRTGGEIVILSEYVMTEVNTPIAINRLLAEARLLATRANDDGELIDYSKSAAFALVDHQVAHVYTRDAHATAAVRALFSDHNSEISLIGREEMQDLKLNHRRSGDLLAVAAPNAWFDYRWWSDPAKAPAFARTVDIHRKPGYDPMELFWDSATNGTSQNSSLVKGSHGRNDGPQPVLIGSPNMIPSTPVLATGVAEILMRILG
jgi:hypothetical protein